MRISDDVVQYVRALVREDFEAHAHYEEALERDGWDGMSQFLAAAFVLAVERRFGAGNPDPGAVIRFVADLRADLATTGTEIEPRAAEKVIRAALDGRSGFDYDQETVATVETVAIYKILSDQEPGEEALDAFLAEAADLAAHYPRA
jgi:uncharacterized protein with PIN domain